MDVQCERCKTEYEFDDALVSGRGTTVRCTNCGHQFKVRGVQGNGANDQWFVKTTEGRELSFGTLRDLQRAILAKQVARADVLLRAGASPRALGSIAELEPFFQGRTSSRPPPAMGPADPAAGLPAMPKGSPSWRGDESPLPPPARTPSIPVVVARPRQAYGSVVEGPRRKMDTLRPPATGTAAPPQASSPLAVPQAALIQPQPIVSAAPPRPHPRPTPPPPPMSMDEAEPSTRRSLPTPMGLPPVATERSMPPPPPRRTARRAEPSADIDLPDMRSSIPSSHEPYSVPRRGRVGGWVVAFVLMLAVGVVGWVVARPYLVGRTAGAASQLDPRAQSFLSQGEAALADGNLDLSKEDFDKASALAEGDPHVLLDQARLASSQADIPWLKLRLLPAGANDEVRTTKAQLDERVSRAQRASEAALAIGSTDVAAVRAKIDALRLAGERDTARGYVSKVIGQASQPETAYVLAALDLAEPEPLWTTVIERLKFAAAGEGNAGRARAALVYALARSGDLAGAKTELAKLDALVRPYPLLPNLSSFLERSQAKPLIDAGAVTPSSALSAARAESPAAAPATQPGAVAAPVSPAANPGGGDTSGGDPRLGMQAASQAIRKGDWDRARQIYDGIVARNPSDSEALCGLGDVARAQGDSAGAIATYKRAISVNPSYLPALLGVADTQWITGDHGGAVRGYKDIADRFPEGTYPGYVKTRAEGTQGAPVSTASTTTAAPAPKSPGPKAAAPSTVPGEPSE
jgi:predicted Zn finger-like uncharacterized protein